MAESMNDAGPGGFLNSILPSPPASSANSVAAEVSRLPQPRESPLKAGSAKEGKFIDFIDAKLLHISRRYEKRFNAGLGAESDERPENRGYHNFSEMVQDMESVVDIVWISGTPSLQVSYLLNVALTVSTSMTVFSFSPSATFRLLDKLDLALCSLLRGVDAETGLPLPGFIGGRSKPNVTQMIRMRGIIERTRVNIVDVASKRGTIADGESVTSAEKYTTTDDEEPSILVSRYNDDSGTWDMKIARVYERSLVELGMSLDSTAAPLISDC